jgi:hypothetical protein
MIVISNQGQRPDCMLHSLVNLTVCKDYKHAKRLNQRYDKQFENSEYKKYGINFCCEFIPYVLNKLNLKYYNRKCFMKVKDLPENFNGILVVKGNAGVGHAVAVRNGIVLDSHYIYGKRLNKYKNQHLHYVWQLFEEK